MLPNVAPSRTFLFLSPVSVVSLFVQWAALGIVGVVVDNSVLQLSLFCAMHTVSFLLLVVFKPFANR